MNADRNRVLIVTQHYPPDRFGNASRMADTAKNLAAEGWDVTVVAAPPSYPHGRFERSFARRTTTERDGVTVHRLWTWQPATEDPGFVSRVCYYLVFAVHAALWLLVTGGRFDVVLTTSPPIFTGLPGLAARAVGRTPWVVDVRDLWIDASVDLGFVAEGTTVERLSRRFERAVLAAADGVTVTTRTSETRLARTYGIDEAKMAHVPNGVDTALFSPTEADPDPVVMYAGNVGHAQDLEVCVRAMRRLDAESARLVVVGDGDARPELERLVEELGLEDRVRFRGAVPRERVPELLASAAVGVAPLKDREALRYAVPTKVYEYMACRLPVLATGTGEVEKLLERTGSGVAVDNDPDEVARAMAELLADDRERAAMGENGRRYVVENYDRRAITRRLSDRLQAALSERTSREGERRTVGRRSR